MEARRRKEGAKKLDRFPLKDHERISAALDELTQNPHAHAVKHLKPGSTQFSMRVGNYRIFFDIVSDYRLITVHTIERRSSTTYR